MNVKGWFNQRPSPGGGARPGYTGRQRHCPGSEPGSGNSVRDCSAEEADVSVLGPTINPARSEKLTDRDNLRRKQAPSSQKTVLNT